MGRTPVKHVTVYFDNLSDEELAREHWKYEQEFDLPCDYEVCGHCRGTGGCSCHLGAFTRDDLYEQGEEFIEDYRRGNFDQACEECKGERVVAKLARARIDERILAALDAADEAAAQLRAEERAEYRMTAEYAREVRGF
jgi:hypothetical protein